MMFCLQKFIPLGNLLVFYNDVTACSVTSLGDKGDLGGRLEGGETVQVVNYYLHGECRVNRKPYSVLPVLIMYNIYLALHLYSNVGVLISPHNIL